MEDPPRKFFRLGPGREVRLRWAYFLKCNDVVKNDAGEITEIHCTYDVDTKGGNAPDGRKVKATLHWVSAAESVPLTVRLYDHLFVTEDPDDTEDESGSWQDNLNQDSLKTLTAQAEPSLAAAEAGYRCQFERKGYFVVDQDSTTDERVFNRIVTLKDAWARAKKKK